jgi:hypothetical protein
MRPVASAALLALCLAPATAHADAAGWAALGGGALAWQTDDGDELTEDELTLSPTMTIDMGIGTSPQADFLFGGIFRVMPVFTEGADIALLFRFAPSGFQSGPINFALDAGGYARFWGVESAGFTGDAILGLPLGFEIGAMGMVGSSSTWGVGGFASIDFVRLTVGREHLLEWWPNPQPDRRATAASD